MTWCIKVMMMKLECYVWLCLRVLMVPVPRTCFVVGASWSTTGDLSFSASDTPPVGHCHCYTAEFWWPYHWFLWPKTAQTHSFLTKFLKLTFVNKDTCIAFLFTVRPSTAILLAWALQNHSNSSAPYISSLLKHHPFAQLGVQLNLDFF
jgi:hypothetical protein